MGPPIVSIVLGRSHPHFGRYNLTLGGSGFHQSSNLSCRSTFLFIVDIAIPFEIGTVVRASRPREQDVCALRTLRERTTAFPKSFRIAIEVKNIAMWSRHCSRIFFSFGDRYF